MQIIKYNNINQTEDNGNNKIKLRRIQINSEFYTLQI